MKRAIHSHKLGVCVMGIVAARVLRVSPKLAQATTVTFDSFLIKS